MRFEGDRIDSRPERGTLGTTKRAVTMPIKAQAPNNVMTIRCVSEE